jgi:hypothetical protein
VRVHVGEPQPAIAPARSLRERSARRAGAAARPGSSFTRLLARAVLL